MKLNKLNSLVVALGLVGYAQSGYASSINANITIWDSVGLGSIGGYPFANEPGETEPNTTSNPSWDLQKWMINIPLVQDSLGQDKLDPSGKYTLTASGGWNFQNGLLYSDGNYYDSGDFFIDVDGNMTYGNSLNPAPGTSPYLYSPVTILNPTLPGGINRSAKINATFGYDYVVHVLSWTTGAAELIKLDSSSVLWSPTLPENTNTRKSAPWRWESGGTTVDGQFQVTFDTLNGGIAYADPVGSYEYQAWGNAAYVHYAASFQLSTLLAPKSIGVHTTMECGNDNLMGYRDIGYDLPDGGMTLVTLGLGMLGLGVFVRRRE